MQIKFPFDSTKPIFGEASVEIDKCAEEVFNFVAKRFFHNYPKWAAEVIELQPLDGEEVCIGAKARLVREDNGSVVESIFEVIEYNPPLNFMFKGLTAPYQHSYLIESEGQKPWSRLTFKFELLEVEIFMRPFQKLLRVAIEDGAESTIENIKTLLTLESTN